MTLSAPAGPYVRVTVGVGAPVGVTIKGQSLQASVVFEQRTTSAGTKVVRVAFTSVSLFLGDPTPQPGKPDGMGLRLTDGSGAILLTAAGVAGQVEGNIALVGLPVSINATLKLQVNNLGVPVAEIVQFAGVDTGTTTQGTASAHEVQTVTVTATTGTYTLAYDKNANGRIDANEMTAPLAVTATSADVESALETLTGQGLAVTGSGGAFTVTWDAVGQPRPAARQRARPQPAQGAVPADRGRQHRHRYLQQRQGRHRRRRHGARRRRVRAGRPGRRPGHQDRLRQRLGRQPDRRQRQQRWQRHHLRVRRADHPPARRRHRPGRVSPATPAVTTTTGGLAGVLTGRVDISGVGGANLGIGFNTTGAAVKQTVAVGDGTHLHRPRHAHRRRSSSRTSPSTSATPSRSGPAAS